DGYSQLSAYERKRLKNITENAKFFAALQLHKSAARLQQIAVKQQPHVTKRPKPRKTEDLTGCRRSMRLQRVEPLDMLVLKMPPSLQAPKAPAGPLPMVPEGQSESSELAGDLLATWTRINELTLHLTPSRYRDVLSTMVLGQDDVRKLVKYRVCSLAIHPSESVVFVAAGDNSGQIGLWNVSSGSAEGASVFFVPHNESVSCLLFSPGNPAHLLSLSSESLRCGDVTRAVFDEVLRCEENLSSFDFLDDGASTAVVGFWSGDVAVVDRRTPRTSPELSADIGFRRTRTVHVHPVHRQYFVAAGAVDVCVYDVRHLKRRRNDPVSALEGHKKSVASAYFSPVTGNRVVTVCADDMLRVGKRRAPWGEFSPSLLPLLPHRHDNSTGRWLTRFRAVWDPKQENCFVVGSMEQPRKIEVFQDTGELLHCFSNTECLRSVCSIITVHPTQNILVGGNSSGRLYVF
ncbi:WDR76 protein, partial [Heliornis fulica]|nr:WDR76 protein [Heliornis fulica]